MEGRRGSDIQTGIFRVDTITTYHLYQYLDEATEAIKLILNSWARPRLNNQIVLNLSSYKKSKEVGDKNSFEFFRFF